MSTDKKLRPLSEKKRNDIITHASKLFMKKGFGAISMDEISTSAGVSKRTLYNHFPTKKILFSEIVKKEWQKVQYDHKSTENILEPEKFLTDVMINTFKIMFSDRMLSLLKLVIAESSKFPELKSMNARYGMESSFNEFTKYIEFLCKKGILKLDNPRIAAAQYIGLIKECIYWPWFFGSITKPSEQHQREIIERANQIFFGHYRNKKQG